MLTQEQLDMKIRAVCEPLRGMDGVEAITLVTLVLSMLFTEAAAREAFDPVGYETMFDTILGQLRHAITEGEQAKVRPLRPQ